MKRVKRFFILTLSFILLSIQLLGCSSATPNEPIYELKRPFRIAAYMSPPSENAGYSTDRNNENYINDENYKIMADCGINYAYALFEYTEEQVERALKLSDKYKINYIIRDGGYFGDVTIDSLVLNKRQNYEVTDREKKELKARFDKYKKYKSFCGVLASDEPSVKYNKNIKMARDFFLKEYEDKEFLVNLLPSYANANQMGVEKYSEYVDRFIKETNPKELSYDNYALMYDGNGELNLGNDYVLNLQTIASAAKKANIPFYTFLLTVGHGAGRKYRTPDNYDDIAWQVYSSMAFGASGVQTFTYWTPLSGDTDPSITYAVVDKKGKPTKVYYALQETAKEVRAFDDIFSNFEWNGSMLIDENEDCRGFNVVNDKLLSHEKIKNVNASEDLILGCFKDKNNTDGFMLANYADPALDRSNEIKIKFNDCKYVFVCYKNERKIVKITKNTYTTKLNSGEGQFIIPLVSK